MDKKTWKKDVHQMEDEVRAAAADNFIEWVNACCAQRN